MNLPTAKYGFTLIEVLVAIAIIGLLSSVVILSVSEARGNARDIQRMNDLKTMQLALRLYAEQYGSYPAQGCGNPSEVYAGPGTHESWGCTAEDYVVGLAPKFIPVLPKDPSQEYEDSKGYIYMSNGKDYKFMAHDSAEQKLITSYDDEFARCSQFCSEGSGCGITPQPRVYAVYSSGAVCW